MSPTCKRDTSMPLMVSANFRVKRIRIRFGFDAGRKPHDVVTSNGHSMYQANTAAWFTNLAYRRFLCDFTSAKSPKPQWWCWISGR
jgi:hypothetical protein